MSWAAIRVEGLGKMYRIGGPVERYKTLRESMTRAVAGTGRKLSGLFGGGNGSGPRHETIWALKDVSFEVQPGEVVGIIGRNGAGKSTLLKILSRITEPTEGRVEIRGRVGSLLEVGTGFHPELTGRENVYLNGAILGMKRAEVDRKFDEIVAFAEVEKFIDTPVKHYSSGMYLRLAFAVAAHLEPDILLVDEVLAVGDLDFQRKCTAKMQQVSQAGKTVLFVSHNLTAVKGLCNAAMLLNKGVVVESGDVAKVLEQYMERSTEEEQLLSEGVTRRKGRHRVVITGCRLVDRKGERTSCIATGEELRVEVDYENSGNLEVADFEVKFKDEYGMVLTTMSTFFKGEPYRLRRGHGTALCIIPQLTLAPGSYEVELNCMTGSDVEDLVPSAVGLTVNHGQYHGAYVRINKRWHGPLVVSHRWE